MADIMAGESPTNWLQWGLTTIFGLFSLIFGGWSLHQSQRVDKISEELNRTKDQMATNSAIGDDKIWKALEDHRRESAAALERHRLETSGQYNTLRTLMERNHEEAERYRSNIQSTMATKMDVHRETDRMVDEIDRIVEALTAVRIPRRSHTPLLPPHPDDPSHEGD